MTLDLTLTFGDIRRVGNRWVAADVCRALDLGNTAGVLANAGVKKANRGRAVVSTSGGPQEMTTIGLRDVLHVIARSRKPIATRLRDWVLDQISEESAAPSLPLSVGRKPSRKRGGSPSVGTRYVYFAQLGHLVKIGYSIRPVERVASFCGAQLLATTPGTQTTEKALHRRFATLRHHGEWFRLEEPLATLIAGLRKPEGDPS